MTLDDGKETDNKKGRLNLERPKTIRSKLLFEGGDRLIIEHAEQYYCLRITRNEKLILTKN